MSEPYIQTFSGRKFSHYLATEDDFVIEDIAHALSNICRFTGHCREFYSVAQHSVEASRIVPEEFALEALMHDAAEAYICDIARPVKRMVDLTEFLMLEDRLMEQIAAKWGLAWPMSAAVKMADNILLLTEIRDFFPNKAVAREAMDSLRVVPLARRITPWGDPRLCSLAFLNRFHELTGVPIAWPSLS